MLDFLGLLDLIGKLASFCLVASLGLLGLLIFDLLKNATNLVKFATGICANLA